MADAAAATAAEAAPADKEKKEAKPAAPPPKGMSMKMVILVGLGAMLLGLGGAVAFLKMGGQSQAPAAAPAHESASADAHGEAGKGAGDKGAPNAIFDLEPFIVNLADAPEVHYLKLTVKLDLDRAGAKEDIVGRLPQVRDAILILLSSKDAASLRSTQGKFQLRDEITSRVNSALPQNGVRTAYFTEFVVQ